MPRKKVSLTDQQLEPGSGAGHAMIRLQNRNIAAAAAARPFDAPITLPGGATPRLLRLARDRSDATAGGSEAPIRNAVASVVLAYRAFTMQAEMPALPAMLGDEPNATSGRSAALRSKKTERHDG